jgi:hypothetical protein
MKQISYAFIFTLAIIACGCNSRQTTQSTAQQSQISPPAPTADSAPSQTIDSAANEAKQQAMARIIVSALHRQGVSANAQVIAGELVVNSDMVENHDQRDILASAIFSKTVQQMFCDVGVRKAIISGGGLFASQDTYDMTCKPTAEELKAKEAKAENLRQDYARHLSSQFSNSNIVSVSAKGPELDFVAKPGLQKSQMLEGVRLMTHSEINSSWCDMAFRQIRLHMDSSDQGTVVPLRCGK